MKNIILACLLVVLAFCTGCGESTAEKRNRSLSKVEVTADQFSKEVGENGWYIQKQTDEVDAWGNKLEVKYKRSSGYETLTVWSNGQDGLPFTRDDISSHSYTLYNSVVLTEIARIKSQNRQEAVENYGFRLTKGLTKSVREGWSDRGDKK